MLNSVTLEVAIGLVFCYASMAVIASAVYEAFASLLKLRARTLLQGVKALLNDPAFTGLARDVYRHALVNPRASGAEQGADAPTIKPSYIDPTAFARALIDAIQKVPTGVEHLRETIDALPDPQLKTLLQGLYVRAEGKADRLEASLAQWSDSGMDRVSGAYKRQAQLFTFLIAALIAGLFNVDSFHLFKTLWGHPAAAATIAAAASKPENVADAITALNALPVGWTAASPAIALSICGWLVTAVSVLFGAPFWFDVLQRFVNLRGTGSKPAAVPPPPTAS